jgi:hypothetical protein
MATSKEMKAEVGSLNNFLGHAGLARQINNDIWNLARDNAPRIFETAINELSNAGYGEQYTRLSDALEVVNSEFETMVHSGHVPTAPESEAQRVINSPNATVGQINAALNVFGHIAQTRANTINEQYRTGTGDSFPNLIYEGNLAAAKALGLDTSKFYVGGRIGGGTIPASQQRDTQTGQQVGAPTVAPNPHAAEIHGGVMRTPQVQPAGHFVGDIISQNGRQMKVTSVDKAGKVTGAVVF